MAGAKEHAKRVAILVAIVGIIFSSAGLTLVLLLQSNNQDSAQTEQERIQQQIQDQLKQQEDSVPKEPLTGYEATPFDKASVTALQVEVLKEGDGPTASAESTVNANYFGWTSDGTIFDSTNKGGTITPIDFPLNAVIVGWTEGLSGQKQGSVVKLVIPADKAYGETGSPPSIGPNEPLAFIVEIKEVK